MQSNFSLIFIALFKLVKNFCVLLLLWRFGRKLLTTGSTHLQPAVYLPTLICYRPIINQLSTLKLRFTLHDSLPSLLDRTRVYQCKRGGAKARPIVSPATSTARAVVSDCRSSQPIGILLFQRIFTEANLFISWQLPLNKLGSKSKVHLL